jgi:hypothetical protein
MKSITIAAIIGFCLGSAGYIIFRFWLLPIRRYRRIKDQITESIRGHELKLSNERTFQLSPDQSKTCHKQATALTDLYYDDLPHWYRMVLNNRKECPEGASKNLKALASSNRNPDHARSRIYNIKNNLNLSREQAKG